MTPFRPGRITAAAILAILFGVFLLLFGFCGLWALWISTGFLATPEILPLIALSLEAVLAIVLIVAGSGLLAGSSWGRPLALVATTLGILLLAGHAFHYVTEVIPERMNIAPMRRGAPFDFFRVGFQRSRSAMSFVVLGFLILALIDLIAVLLLCLRPIPPSPPPLPREEYHDDPYDDYR